MSRIAAVTLALSIVGHALFLGFGAPRKREVPKVIERGAGPAVLAATDTFERKQRAQAQRRALVEQARADRAKGTLLLGRFVLDANRIDADEDGQIFEYENALSKYEKRLSDLREVLRDEPFIVFAVSSTFGDLRYHGRPGGRMGDALLDGGGSCEQVAQLVVAAAFDVGRGKEVSFRVYGKPGPDGAAHLAPMGKYDGKDFDLMTGSPAAPGGARVLPDDLVEVYARVHGLAPPLEGALAKKGTGNGAATSARVNQPNAEPERRSLASGFPPNDDGFPGSLPLFAERAIKPPMMAGTVESGADDAEVAAERARHCAYFLRMASLSPLTVDALRAESDDEDALSVEAVRVPNGPRLEREARLLRAAEDLATNPYVDAADHLLGYACMAALGEVAAIDFSLAGERRLAALALETGNRGRAGGKKLLADVNWKSAEGVATTKRLRTDFAGNYWLLLFLEGGDDVVLDLARRGDSDDWGRISSMAALLLYPNTRARALDLMTKFSRREQVDVMHEIFHAHDHLRPWATNYEFDVPTEASASAQTFFQVYQVFRRIAFRLWEGQREPSETVDAFLIDAREAGLDMAWQAAIIDYYARNVLGLYSQRNKGLEIMLALKRAMQYNTHPSLDPLRRQMAYIEAQGRLDVRTLADAFRQR
ncbi:MAG: hypothetical protein IPM54_23045 [Polyangiaceae bacterium]|nr:hypothetical protein [Polyangiaceae bacterium]